MGGMNLLSLAMIAGVVLAAALIFWLALGRVREWVRNWRQH